MTDLEIAARVLQAAPHDCYCESCLASALQIPASTIADIAGALVRRADYERRDAVCVGCGLNTATIVYVPIKCARCSETVDPADLIIARGDHFHQYCWQILESDARIADSRQMARLSQELVARSLRRLEPPGRA
jgi:hypothetical protein